MKAKLLLALAIVGASIVPAAAAGDAVRGETVFKKCMACHAVGDGARNKVGPVLNGIVGRTAGTGGDYKYSNAMVEAGAGGLPGPRTSWPNTLPLPRPWCPAPR
jgi:cytochrome c